MCGRYVLVSKVAKIEKVFNVTSTLDDVAPSYNIGAAHKSPIICSDDTKALVEGRFGYVPSYNIKQLLINARSEKLLTNSEWRKAFSNNRCIVPADCFYEGPTKEKLSKPYLVYLKNKIRPFGFAGIYRDQEIQGEIRRTFAILTTSPGKVMHRIGHHRSPIVLHPNEHSNWLNTNQPIANASEILQNNINELMNAYPVSAEMKSGKENHRGLIEPIGQRLMPEYDYETQFDVEVQGMGHRKGAKDAERLPESIEKAFNKRK